MNKAAPLMDDTQFRFPRAPRTRVQSLYSKETLEVTIALTARSDVPADARRSD